MGELFWKTAGRCLLQQLLHLGYPHDEDTCKLCINIVRTCESCTQTWQGCNKAVFITTSLFARTFARLNHTFSWSGYSWPAIALFKPALSPGFLVSFTCNVCVEVHTDSQMVNRKGCVSDCRTTWYGMDGLAQQLRIWMKSWRWQSRGRKMSLSRGERLPNRNRLRMVGGGDAVSRGVTLLVGIKRAWLTTSDRSTVQWHYTSRVVLIVESHSTIKVA